MYNNEKRVTESQRQAVRFCESMTGQKFKGRIDSYHDVSHYLDKWLSKAKRIKERRDESSRKSGLAFYEEFGSVIARRKTRRG